MYWCYSLNSVLPKRYTEVQISNTSEGTLLGKVFIEVIRLK